jgi:shikimate dehydrogenase
MLWGKGIHGLNITVPHKEAVLAYVTSQSPVVASVGAANTLLRTTDGWHAENTDITGFWASLLPATQHAVTGDSAWILGSGGSAKAMVAALCPHNVGAIHFLSRSHGKTQPLLEWLATHHSQVSAHWHLWGTPPPTEPPVLIINATSVGLSKTDDAHAFDWLWHNGNVTRTAAMDLMYRLNIPTAFVAAAQQAGCANVSDGLGMLVHQGADAFTLWTGNRITADLRQAAYSHLLSL